MTCVFKDTEPKIFHLSLSRSLVLTTVLVAFCAEFLIGAIADIFKKWHLTETFIGLILLPIVSNSAEHVMAVKFAMKDKMDAAISASMGSSIQIALFVTPLTVIIGWGMNVPMTLYFNVYATAVMFISVLIANYLIAVSNCFLLRDCYRKGE